MNRQHNQGVRLRKPTAQPEPESAPASAPAPDPVTPAIATPARQDTPSHQTNPPRTPTDFDGLREVAEMDRAEVAALLDAYAPARRGTAARQGQRVRGTISRLTPTLAFVALGGKADASIDRAELDPDVAVGSTIDAYVVSTKDGEVRLARTLGGDSTRALLDDAVENRIPVQGRVVSRNEHGFEVQLSGGVRAFCPVSQIDHAPETDLDAYLGRSLSFRVLDVRGREAIVSHRAIAEIAAKEAAEQAFGQVREGAVYDGVVTGIREFGAFVRIAPGVEGLVRLPNLAHKRVTDAASAVTEGQAVRVRVLGVDTARRRLDLGIRQVEEGDAPAKDAAGGAMTTGGTFGTLGQLLGGVKTRR